VAKITIPDEYQPGILKLFSLHDDAVSSLKHVLSTEADDVSARELAGIVSPEIPTVPEKEIYAVLRSLRALYAVRSNMEAPLDEFVSDLADAVEDHFEEGLSAEQVERFKKNVAALMTIDPFAIHVKGRDLQTEDERTFCRARILTDLRPVFGEDIEEGPKGMVIMHHLKLGFHQDGPNHNDFHLSMDSEDLQTLKSVIERAEAKAKSLRENLPEIRYLGI
jgi:hypothetical protein